MPGPADPLVPVPVPNPDKPAIYSVTNWFNGVVLILWFASLLLGPSGDGKENGFVEWFGPAAAALLAGIVSIGNLILRNFTSTGIGGFLKVPTIVIQIPRSRVEAVQESTQVAKLAKV